MLNVIVTSGIFIISCKKQAAPGSRAKKCRAADVVLKLLVFISCCDKSDIYVIAGSLGNHITGLQLNRKNLITCFRSALWMFGKCRLLLNLSLNESDFEWAFVSFTFKPKHHKSFSTLEKNTKQLTRSSSFWKNPPSSVHRHLLPSRHPN